MKTIAGQVLLAAGGKEEDLVAEAEDHQQQHDRHQGTLAARRLETHEPGCHHRVCIAQIAQHPAALSQSTVERQAGSHAHPLATRGLTGVWMSKRLPKGLLTRSLENARAGGMSVNGIPWQHSPHSIVPT